MGSIKKKPSCLIVMNNCERIKKSCVNWNCSSILYTTDDSHNCSHHHKNCSWVYLKFCIIFKSTKEKPLSNTNKAILNNLNVFWKWQFEIEKALSVILSISHSLFYAKSQRFRYNKTLHSNIKPKLGLTIGHLLYLAVVKMSILVQFPKYSNSTIFNKQKDTNHCHFGSLLVTLLTLTWFAI